MLDLTKRKRPKLAVIAATALLISLRGVFQPVFASGEQSSALIEKGQSQLEARDYRGAISTFTKAVLLMPNSAAPYFNRGLVRFQLEDEFGALEDFDDAVQRNPRFAKAYLYRGSVLLSLGDQTNGLLDLRQAAELFEAQGDESGYQRSVKLIRHFNPEIAPSTK